MTDYQWIEKKQVLLMLPEITGDVSGRFRTVHLCR
jgi:hypothetical protein